MSKVTAKLQLTLPKALAKQFHIRAGDEVSWIPAGESLRLVPRPHSPRPASGGRVKLFDAATERQRARNKRQPRVRSAGRGWTREELYGRGLPR